MSRPAPLLLLLAGAAVVQAAPPGPAAPDAAAVPLIDAHGLTVTAAVPAEGAETLDLTLSLTPRARDLLLEDGRDRPEHWELYGKLGDADGAKVPDAVGKLWRWYDYLSHGTEYPPQDLDLPDLTEYWTSYFFASYQNFRGESGDGFSIDIRKPEYGGWFYRGSRTFVGERSRVIVKLNFSEDDPRGRGRVSVDGQTLFECRPGADSYDGEFARRFARSRLWETVDARSYRLARDRLDMLLGREYEVLLGMLRTHPDRLEFQIVLTPGPSARSATLKAVEVMEREAWRTEDRTAVGVGGTVSAVAVPGAIAGRLGLGVTYERESNREGEQERAVRIEFQDLEAKLPTGRDPAVYLLALHHSIAQARLHTDREVWRQVLDNLLAEAELELRPVDKGGTPEEPTP